MKHFLCVLFYFCVGCSSAAPSFVVPPKVGPTMYPDADLPLPVTVDLHVDTAFTLPERQALQDAAGLWKVQTSGLADINLIFDWDWESVSSIAYHQAQGHHTLKRLESWMDEVKREDASTQRETGSSSALILGEVWPPGGVNYRPRTPIRMMVVADRLTTWKGTVQIPLHEFGHIFGVWHNSDNVDGIMYPAHIPKKHVCLRPSDLLGFCTAQDCGSMRMYPCEN